MKESHVTAGSKAFAYVVRRHGGPTVAGALGRSSGAIRNIAAGRRLPGGALVAAIATAYGIPEADWERPPEEGPRSGQGAPEAVGPPGAAAEAMPPPEAPSQPEATASEASDPKALAMKTIERLGRDLDDPDGTPKERATIATAMTSATRLLAKVSGSIELTPSQVLRSPTWRQLQGVVIDALRPYPQALEAISKALRHFDKQGSK